METPPSCQSKYQPIGSSFRQLFTSLFTQAFFLSPTNQASHHIIRTTPALRRGAANRRAERGRPAPAHIKRREPRRQAAVGRFRPTGTRQSRGDRMQIGAINWTHRPLTTPRRCADRVGAKCGVDRIGHGAERPGRPPGVCFLRERRGGNSCLYAASTAAGGDGPPSAQIANRAPPPRVDAASGS